MPPAPLPQQLDELAELLGRMCTAVAGALHRATAALLESRARLAENVITGDAAVDALRMQVQELAGDALLFHQPVAGDLRAVVSAIRAAGDIERMGDLAVHVAKVARIGRKVPTDAHQAIRRMSELAVDLALKTATVVRSRNVIMALELDADDDPMDTLHQHMFEVLMSPDWCHGVPAAVDLTLLARYYERFADHAVTVAHHTIYAVTGEAPDAIPI
jgi:phosphate transport system protein